MRSIVVALAGILLCAMAAAGQANAEGSFNLRSAITQAPVVTDASNEVGNWEVEGSCSGEPCFATMTISIGGQESVDPFCSPGIYCVTSSGFYGEGVSISPGGSGSWTYNCKGCRGTLKVQIHFEGDKFTGTAEPITEEGVGQGTLPYNGHLVGGPPQPELDIYPATVAEPRSGTSPITFPVMLSEASTNTVTVEYSTQDGSGPTGATSPSDFEATHGTLTFAPGVTDQDVTVAVDRGDFAGNRTFKVVLSGAHEATIATGEATGTIEGWYTLSGKVIGDDGKGVEGAELLLEDELPGMREKTGARTDAEGHFEAVLPPGHITATVERLNGTQFIPVGSADCAPSNVSCVVELDQNRVIEFSSCVVPNPNGEPLPSGTPDPIPGAHSVGNLEAVGCWTSQANGSYTSTQPVVSTESMWLPKAAARLSFSRTRRSPAKARRPFTSAG